jgi:DNA (cytosine-5)-methyltransferase 1
MIENMNDKKRLIKVASLFSGLGGFEMGLSMAFGEELQMVFASEIDKYASKGYELIHGMTPHGDITQVDEYDIPDHDLLVAGFPCQPFSQAGKRLGMTETRGTLFFEIMRIASHKKPKMLLLENVKGLINHDKGNTLETILFAINECGYLVDFSLLNSKYFDLPQSRERVFFVCKYDPEFKEHEPWTVEKGKTDVISKAKKKYIQQGILKTFNFDWPAQKSVNKRLRDVLEPSVDEKYYLSKEKTDNLIARLNKDKLQIDTDDDSLSSMSFEGNGLSPNVDASYHKGIGPSDLDKNRSRRVHIVEEPKIVHNIYGGFGEEEPRVFDIAPTIRTSAGGGHIPSVLLPNWIPTKNDITRTVRTGGKESLSDKHNWDMIAEETGCSLRTRSYMGQEQQLEVREDNLSNTITSVQKDSMVVYPLTRARTEEGKEARRNGNDPFQGKVPAVRDDELVGTVTATQNLEQQLLEVVQNKQFSEDGEGISHCIDANYAKGTSIGDYGKGRRTHVVESPEYRIRRLTPKECMRLQGFPDQVTDILRANGISDAQIYKMAGNAVSTNVIKALALQLKPYLVEGE